MRNTQTIKANLVKEPLVVGDFCYDDKFEYIYIILPGHKDPDAIAISKSPNTGNRIWQWDGNIENPTLQPSIHSLNTWHGYLENGILRSC